MKKLIIVVLLFLTISPLALTKKEATDFEREVFVNLRSRKNGDEKRKLVLRLDKVREKIKENNLEGVEEELTKINEDASKLKKDSSFIKRLVISLILTVVISFFSLRKKKTNNLYSEF